MAYVTICDTKGGRNGPRDAGQWRACVAMAAPKEVGGAGDGHTIRALFAWAIHPVTARRSC